MPSASDIQRYSRNYQDEIDAAALYHAMAEKESSPELAEVYRRLADIEEKHARLWAQKLKEAGVNPESFALTFRTRLKRSVVRWFGPSAILPLMAQQETADRGRYDKDADAGREFPQDERSHARVLTMMARTPSLVGSGNLARLEGRHRTIGGNALRAAVLGANDGLVSNLSLVMGVAGAQLSESTILVTGLAGLLAGACSMAIGEWISVQSSRELNERHLAVEADELDTAPAEEEEELRLIYQAKGLPELQARELAKRLISDKSKALDTLAREELGIDPDELGGSPWVAAGTSFLLFALGALLPVSPFFIVKGHIATALSLGLSMLGLFVMGAGITLVTGRPVFRTGIRQLAFGLLAAGVTYGVGHLLGVNLAG